MRLPLADPSQTFWRKNARRVSELQRNGRSARSSRSGSKLRVARYSNRRRAKAEARILERRVRARQMARARERKLVLPAQKHQRIPRQENPAQQAPVAEGADEAGEVEAVGAQEAAEEAEAEEEDVAGNTRRRKRKLKARPLQNKCNRKHRLGVCATVTRPCVPLFCCVYALAIACLLNTVVGSLKRKSPIS